MIIQCDKCNTRFKLDDSRVSGGGVKVRCTKCQNVFLVSPPPAPETPATKPPSAASPEGKGGAPPGLAPAKPKGETTNLKFDFERPEPAHEKELPDAGRAAPAAEPSAAAGQQREDSGYLGDRAQGEAGGALTAATGAADEAGEGAPPVGGGGFDFRFDADEEKAGGKEAPSSAAALSRPDFSLDFKIEAPWGAKAAGDKEAPPVAPAPSDAAARRAAQAPPDLFGSGRAMEEEAGAEDEEREPREGGAETPAAARAPYETYVEEGRQTRSRAPKLIALAVIIIAALAIYFTGAFSTLKGRLTGPSETAGPGVEIEAVNGYFVDNRSAGRVFIIESRVRNATDEPQKIRRVKGTIYNAKGDVIASRDVSPGRVLSADEVKGLPAEELQRQFDDPSGGAIPPRGTVPVMVLFTGAPEGIAEFGIDIVR